jgi:hypothetical protein
MDASFEDSEAARMEDPKADILFQVGKKFANIILRYILNDHEELSEKAAEILENNEVTLKIEVAREVTYVL